jgi:tetratricopeptide (TPR) repeat protein
LSDELFEHKASVILKFFGHDLLGGSMRSKLIAALIVAAMSGTAHAQSDPVGVCKDPRGCTASGGGSSTDSYPTIFGTRPLIEDLQDLFGGQEKQEGAHRSSQEQARQQRLQEAQAANNRGIAFANNGDWANSVTAHAEAVAKDPDDPVMRDNLVRARAGLANARGLETYNKGDFAGAVALFQEAESVDSRQDIFRQNLAAAQAALANAQAQLEIQRRDKAAAQHMQKAIQGFAQTLKAVPAGGGLDFDGGNAASTPDAKNGGGLDFAPTVAAAPPAAAASPPPSGDPNVVDARVPSGLSKPVENAIAGAYVNAPPGVSDRVRKGFQAVATSDWKVAKAWFEDALVRDPGNADLKRLVATIGQPPKGADHAGAPSQAAAPAIHDLATLNANAGNMSTGQIMDSLGEIIAAHLVESAVSGN